MSSLKQIALKPISKSPFHFGNPTSFLIAGSKYQSRLLATNIVNSMNKQGFCNECYVFTNHPIMKEFYEKNIIRTDRRIIFDNFDENELNAVLSNAEEFIISGDKTPQEQKIVMVFDNCYYENADKMAFAKCMFNGRHYGISCIFVETPNKFVVSIYKYFDYVAMNRDSHDFCKNECFELFGGKYERNVIDHILARQPTVFMVGCNRGTKIGEFSFLTYTGEELDNSNADDSEDSEVENLQKSIKKYERKITNKKRRLDNLL